MAFEVTARKYRPQRFDEVVGQEHITTTLKNSIAADRVAHAYLMTGPRGVGKTTTARILAKALNCLDESNAEPCNSCEMCEAIQRGQLMDIVEIDAASNRGIDEIRSLRESVKYAPTKGKYKVYIIDEVHMLTRESFNALLKTLEEPPSHTVFVFATTDAHRVPTTIVSRCQRYDFRRISADEIKTLLASIAERENIAADDKTLSLIARKADGGLRDAESFFDQAAAFCDNTLDFEAVVKAFNFIDDEIYFSVTDAALERDFAKAFEVADAVYQNGWSFQDFLDGLVEHYRNLMSVVASGTADYLQTAEVYKKRFQDYVGSFDESDLLRSLAYLNKTSNELRFSQNHKLKTEIALCSLVGLERASSMRELVAALEKGEPTAPSPAPVKKKPVAEEHSAEPVSSPASETPNRETPKSPPRGNDRNVAPPNAAPRNPEPKIEDSAAPTLESVRDKWNSFWSGLVAAKPMTFNDGQTAPVALEGKVLRVRIDDEETGGLLKTEKRFVNAKLEEFFGKPLWVAFEKSASTSDASKKPASRRAQPKKEDSPFVSAIIGELGGQEIDDA